jgi:chromosome segregation ATPase
MWSNMMRAAAPPPPVNNDDDDDLYSDQDDNDEELYSDDNDDEEIYSDDDDNNNNDPSFSSTTNRPPAVGTMFMGRLSRFLEQVTHHSEDSPREEAVGVVVDDPSRSHDGWGLGESSDEPNAWTADEDDLLGDLESLDDASVGGDPFPNSITATDEQRSSHLETGFDNHDGYEDTSGNENDTTFGPVVDQTPREHTITVAFDRQSSLAVQGLHTTNENLDLDDEHITENEDWRPASTATTTNLTSTSTRVLVDHTPNAEEISHPASWNVSVGALAPSETDTSVADLPPNHESDDDEQQPPDTDQQHAFGPVVDHTPADSSSIPSSPFVSVVNSMGAVHAATLEEDFRQDDAMDETYYLEESQGDGDATTLDNTSEKNQDNGWGDADDLSLENTEASSAGGEPTAATTTSPPATPVTGYHTASSVSEGRAVVDHVPLEIPQGPPRAPFSDPSLVALAPEDDLTRNSGNGEDEDLYPYGNENEYGPVVDHTPLTPALSRATSGANSMAVHFEADDDDDDDALDDTEFGEDSIDPGSKAPSMALQTNLTEGSTLVDHTPSEMGSPHGKRGDLSVAVLASEDGSKEAGENDSTNEQVVYGPVVDHTPTVPLVPFSIRSDSVIVQAQDHDTVDGTLAGGSTVAAGDSSIHQEVSSQASADDETTDERPSALQSREDQLVDRVPQRPESRFGDASTLVAAEPSDLMSEVDDMAQEEGNFGPVVDLTPPTRSATAHIEPPSGAGSTAVFAPPSIAEDDFEDHDETEGQGGDEGWDHDDPVLEETPNPQSGNDEPVVPPEPPEQPLVDFIPPQEDGTAVVLSSSSHGSQDASEVAVGGAQSLVLQAEDPKEDDFGPVVDQTPRLASSVPRSVVSTTSIATQMTASECRALEKEDNAEGQSEETMTDKRKVVVDHLPSQMKSKRQIDSIATVGRSQLTGDEEEEDDDIEFGPVVDHLPTSRASLAPSRGGSTVDALATVSEVESDEDEDGGGWDDDGDLDVSDGGLSEKPQLNLSVLHRSFRRSTSATSEPERNVSVRFESSVDDIAPKEVASNRTNVLEPEHGEQQSANSTQYFDPDSSSFVALEDRMQPCKLVHEEVPFDKILSEADTPPSTPYRRSSSPPPGQESDSIGAELYHRLLSKRPPPRCVTCCNEESVDCPCVKRLIGDSSQQAELVGFMETSEGEAIKVDFGKLLQDEMTRRRLVEEEVKILRAQIDGERDRDSGQGFLETEIGSLRRSNDDLLERVEVLNYTCSRLEDEKMQLLNQAPFQSETQTNAKDAHIELNAKTTLLESEISHLKELLGNYATVEALDADLKARVLHLEGELSAKSGESNLLELKVMQLEKQLLREAEEKKRTEEEKYISCQQLNEKVCLLQAELAAKPPQSSSLLMSEEGMEEVKALREARNAFAQKVAELQVQHEKELQKQYKLLDKKTAEIRSLEATLTGLSDEKRTALADLSRYRSLANESDSLASELLSVARERDLLQESLIESKEALASLQGLVDTCGLEKEDSDERKSHETEALKIEVERAKEALAAEKVAVVEKLNAIEILRQEKEDYSKELLASQALSASLESQIENMNTMAAAQKAETAEATHKNQQLHNELTTLATKLEESEHSLQEALLKLSNAERQLLEDSAQSLRDAKTISKVKAELAKAQNLAQNAVSQKEALNSEKEDMKRAAIEAKIFFEDSKRQWEEAMSRQNKELSSLRLKCDALDQHNVTLSSELQKVEDRSKAAILEAEGQALETSNRLSQDLERLQEKNSLLSDKLGALNSIEHELQVNQSNLKEVSKERDLLAEENEEMLVQFGLLKEKLDEGDEQVQLLQEEIEILKGSDNVVSSKMVTMQEKHQELLKSNVELSRARDFLEISIAEAGEERRELVSRIRELEVAHEDLIASYSGQEKSSSSTQLQTECNELRNATMAQSSEIVSLKEQLKDFVQNRKEAEELRIRSTQQDEEYQRVYQELISKNEELHELGVQFDTDRASFTSEFEGVKQKLLTRERACIEHYKRVEELEEMLQNTRKELELSREQLDTAKASNRAIEQPSEHGIESTLPLELSATVEGYEQRLNDLLLERSVTEQKIESYKENVSSLEFELQASQAKLEIFQQTHLESLATAESLHLREFEGSIHESEMENLRHQVESLESALESTRARLVTKEEEVDHLNKHLRQTKVAQRNGAAESLEASNSQGHSNDVGSLRSHVMSLAVALERSENRRAEAIDRLLREREGNAESLRRLSESVKRFYSTVSSGDT